MTMAQSQQPRQLPPREGLPRFLENSERQQLPPPKPRQLPPPLPKTPLAKRMIEFFWPAMFWALFAFNTATMTLAVWNIALHGWSAWIHFQAGMITVFSTGSIAIIVKWILNEPQSTPNQRKPATDEFHLEPKSR